MDIYSIVLTFRHNSLQRHDQFKMQNNAFLIVSVTVFSCTYATSQSNTIEYGFPFLNEQGFFFSL